MEQAFLQGSGFAAVDLNVFIRSMLAALYCFWTIWVVYKQFKMVKCNQLEVSEWILNGVWSISTLTLVLILVGT